MSRFTTSQKSRKRFARAFRLWRDTGMTMQDPRRHTKQRVHRGSAALTRDVVVRVLFMRLHTVGLGVGKAPPPSLLTF